MTTRILPALLCLAVFSCGAPLGPEADDPSFTTTTAELKATARAPKPATATWRVQVSASQTTPAFKTAFLITSTYDLFAAFDVPVALAGQHIAAFEFVSPDGVVYQRNEVPFSTGAATSYRVWSSMPVAGTWIQQFSITGAWSVRVFLDAEASPRASAGFSFQ